MLQQIWRRLLIVCLISLGACAHGPNISPCTSSEQAMGLSCTNKNHETTKIPFDNSVGYVFYVGQGLQNLLNYCAAENVAGTAAPEFTSCISSPRSAGINCTDMTCHINATANGVVCAPGPPYLVFYPETDGDWALSPTDNTTLLAYCNISIP